MALFPKIQGPCPYKTDFAAIMDGDTCRVCDRQVVELGGMTDAERIGFLRNCTGEVCVSYALPARIAAAAALAIVAIGAPMQAAAQDYDNVEIVVGAIHDPRTVEYVSDADDADAPALPVVYEAPAPVDTAKTSDEASPPATNAAPQTQN